MFYLSGRKEKAELLDFCINTVSISFKNPLLVGHLSFYFYYDVMLHMCVCFTMPSQNVKIRDHRKNNCYTANLDLNKPN